MRRVALTRGLFALVDDADYERISETPWYAAPRRYTVYGYNDGRGYLHRFILGVTHRGTQVDHVNRDGLDCQRHNLRLATARQQAANTRKRRNGVTSCFRGVYFDPGRHAGRVRMSPWVAMIMQPDGHRRTRSFTSEVEAALAYNAWATEFHGDFASLNVVA